MMNATDWSSVLSRLAATAALAPSSHNCQPWQLIGLCRAEFEVDMQPAPHTSEGWSHTLLVCIDRRRALRALPSLEREMRMSVGGFASLLLNLLRLSGFSAQVHFPDTGWQAATLRGRARLAGSEPVLMLYLGEPPGGVQPVTHPLLQWIAQRHTVRGPYVRGATPAPGSACLPYRLAPDDGFAWRYVLPGALFDHLCSFYRHHAAQDFRHGAAWRETYRHLEFSGQPCGGSGVGINIQSLFGPLPAWRRRLYQAVLHPAVMRCVGPLGLHARMGRDFESLVRSSAGIAYLCSLHDGGDERRMHLLAGERVTEIWLSATRDGQAMHPLSVALQHPEIEAQLHTLLGCGRPVLFIARIGTPAERGLPAPRYRRAPQAFCSLEFAAPPVPSISC